MNTIMRISWIHLTILTLASFAIAAEPSDTIFRAMQDELDRSMKQLEMKDTKPPYFLSYRIEDIEMAQIEARYGALVQTDRQNNRYFYSELRVGDMKLDNSNFIGSFDDTYNMREEISDENDYRALRHKIWLLTDQAYKHALELRSGKTAYFQSHPTTDSLPDFSQAEHVEHFDNPIHLTTDIPAWEQVIRSAAKEFDKYPAMDDWKINFTGSTSAKRYLNSEGAKNLKSSTKQILEVSASCQAKDGQRLSAFLRYIQPTEAQPPQSDDLLKDIRKMASDLSAAVNAPKIDEYSGPVLFTDYAAAQLVSELFVSQINQPREIIAGQDWMKNYLPKSGKLTGRLNRRVMPEFVSIIDDPSQPTYEGKPLIGFQAVDDEGVPSKTITLVKEGRLVTLPSTRQPIKKINGSNGHARTLQNQWTIPAVTNLFVKSAKAESREQLLERLRRLCTETGNEYGLMVTLLEDSRISQDYSWADRNQGEQPPLLSAPVLVYKVYAKDGKVEPVRGLIFDEVSIRSLRDIAAMGKDTKVYNILQPAFRQFQYFASIVSPSVLIEEMELKANSAQEPMPISSNPIFEEKLKTKN